MSRLWRNPRRKERDRATTRGEDGSGDGRGQGNRAWDRDRAGGGGRQGHRQRPGHEPRWRGRRPVGGRAGGAREDRKSTRLNSSHLGISYAVFCLKKKTDAKDDVA